MAMILALGIPPGEALASNLVLFLCDRVQIRSVIPHRRPLLWIMSIFSHLDFLQGNIAKILSFCLADKMSAGGSWLYGGQASLCDSLLSYSIKANLILLSHAACVVDGSIFSSWFLSSAAGAPSSWPPSSPRTC